jgi:hypothetical protein
MTLDELIKIADDVYGDGLIAQLYEARKNKQPRPDVGDGLAVFIECELVETYEPEGATSDHLDRAFDALETAIDQLVSVQDAIECV